MQKKINLEEIILKHCYVTQDDVTDVHSSIESVKSAMKEACRQSLELAAENAKIDEIYTEDYYSSNYDGNFKYSIHTDGDGMPYAISEFDIDNQSILDVINLIE